MEAKKRGKMKDATFFRKRMPKKDGPKKGWGSRKEA
jgi:hypothetical protein